MQLGIALDLSSLAPVRPQVDRAVELIEQAEARGFAGVWLGESYHVEPQPFHLPASLMVLAHLAARTNLPLGTAVLLLRAYDPHRLAYDAALLDQLCGGRLTLGIGLGAPDIGARLTPADDRKGAQILDEAIEILRRAWEHADARTGDTTDQAFAVPGPLQTGGPRIFVGGRVAASPRRAASLGDGYYAATNYSDALLERQAAAYWAANPRSPGHVTVTRFCLTRTDGAQARELAARHFATTLGFYNSRGWYGVDGPENSGQLPFVGEPAELIRALRRYEDLGVSSVQLRIAPYGTPPEISKATITWLANTVLPEFV